MIKKITFLLSTGLFVFSSSLFAAPTLWKDSEQQQSQLSAKSTAVILKSRKVELNRQKLNDLLAIDLSLAARPDTASPISPVITLPLPNGGEVRVSAEKVSIMAPQLAQQFPQIRTWRVTGVDDLLIHGRIDLTEHGFHAMLVMPDGDTLFVEPENQSKNQYLSFSKHDNADNFKSGFQCKVHPQNKLSAFLNSPKLAKRMLAKPARSLITYRLAVAVTGEYTQFHGGTKSKALSAIVTTINRVNEVFERDLGVSLELIADEMNIIYTNSSTDPYTSGDDLAMYEENLLNLSDSGDLSKNRYDIGHVFGADNEGGLAHPGGVCNNSFKAGGVTGVYSPVGDAFSISYVAHEMGHQLGATHTFNSSCGGGQRIGSTAVEPGSGSTIMSYAGVCGGGNDLQDNPDPQFHAVSISWIADYTRGDKTGSTCGSIHGVSNQNPEVSAGSDHTIPTQTPFMLIASGSDSDGDTLTYTWEQSDAGTKTNVDIDAGDNAIFRSRPENISSVRFIPRMSELFSNTRVKGERLPVEDRIVNFVVTTRDGRGGVRADGMKINLVSMGRPFSVTSHKYKEKLSSGEQTTVTWDVAGTNSTPINCQQVDISLVDSKGHGQLITKTANDGKQTITIPSNIPSISKARFMVACHNNLFFNISSANLRINTSGSSSDSGGGSMGSFLLALTAIGLIRRKILLRKGNKR